MKKLADLFFNKRPGKNDLNVVAYENMRKEDQGLVEDLMRNSKIMSQVNNACKNVMAMNKGEKESDVANFMVNVSSDISKAANVKVIITLLKESDKNDLRISIFSLVVAPSI